MVKGHFIFVEGYMDSELAGGREPQYRYADNGLPKNLKAGSQEFEPTIVVARRIEKQKGKK